MICSCCQWCFCVILPGWTQDDSYRIRRGGRAERGFVRTAQLGRTTYTGPDTYSVSYEKAPRFPREKGGQVSGSGRGQVGGARGGLEGKTRGIFMSPVGFRHL
ncbi:hypothetical protein KCP75_26225 (plasmid) [Salmonella enterica subsp. enterica]|nr:hypothetical protein KCP73_27230 [Salmonella enterica subsp. enterica]QUJ02651.1 hypothetical protein KCP75_26225 [Salmonella enterica subsp. enterica]